MTHKILAVDDHPETLDIVVITLKQYGYDVIATNYPKEALKLAVDEKPDLILLDVNMPEMDGLEVCRRLRATNEMAVVPIIMFTAEDEPYQKLAGFDAGADDYLTKPTDPDEMIARIEGILGEIDEAEVEQDAEDDESSPSIEYLLEKTVVIPEKKAKAIPAAGKGSVIAVMGARSGAGATLTAINLAATLARQERETTLIDLDTVQGHIALYLNQRVKGSVATLADLPHDNIPAWLPQQVVPVSKHLQLLLAPPNQDGRFSQLSALQANTVVDTLTKAGQNVVIDVGHALNETNRHLLARVDHVVVVLSPERIALAAAKQLLGFLPEVVPAWGKQHAIIFDVNGRMNLPQKAIETYLDHPIQTIIAVSFKELTQAVNKGSILVGVYPDGKTARHFYQLANHLFG